MASTIRCDIVSAEAEIFHGEAEMIVATGELGELGIAPRHAPLITRLKPGKVVVTLPGGEKLDFAISGGISAKFRPSHSCAKKKVGRVGGRCVIPDVCDINCRIVIG